MTQTGRNDRCPCGSGKKYKQCCLAKPELASTEMGRHAHRLNAEENLLFESILEWTGRRFGRGWADAALDEAIPGDKMGDGDPQLYLPWLIYHHPIQGASPATHYAEAIGEKLSTADRHQLGALTGAWLSCWEVRRVEPGVGVEVFDLLSHETRFVHEVRASKTLERWLVILGYVADYPGVSVFAGIHPKPLAPLDAGPVLKEARTLLRAGRVPATPDELREPTVAMGLLRNWYAGVLARDLRLASPPGLQNTDGDPLLFCTDHFAIQPGGHAEVVRRLQKMPGAEREEDKAGKLAITFLKQGNRMHASWENTVIGRATLSDLEISVETNSTPRADSLRRLIETAAKDLVRFRKRTRKDPGDLLAAVAAGDGPIARPAAPPRPEIQTLLREAVERHYEGWLDERIPALGGLTPRAAVKRPASRARLVALLKDIELGEHRKDAAERFDVGKLWRALGLDPEHPLGLPERSQVAETQGAATLAREGSPTRRRASRAKRTGLRLSGPVEYILKVRLIGSQPPIWRRIGVASEVRFDALHRVLQTAMGWQDQHLHMFEARGKQIGPAGHDQPGWTDEQEIMLGQVLRLEGDRLTYRYDFGDGWQHDVLLERIEPAQPAGLLARCLGGRRTCPPEDSGGVGGYAGMLRALEDRKHPDHARWSEWAPADFDPDAFEVLHADECLRGFVARNLAGTGRHH